MTGPPDPDTPDAGLAAARRAVAERPDDVAALDELGATLYFLLPCGVSPNEPPPDDGTAALVDEALDVLGRWTARSPSDRRAADYLAAACRVGAEVSAARGEVGRAASLIDESVARFRALLDGAEDAADAADELADSLEVAVRLARGRGDTDLARVRLSEAIDVRRGIAAAEPPERSAYWLAAVLDDLGDLECDAGDPSAAAAAYREAADLYASVAATDESARAQLPGCLRDLGDALRKHGDDRGALAADERAVAAARRAVAEQPEDPDARRGLAAALESVADGRWHVDDRAGARAALTEALDLHRALLASQPGDHWEWHVAWDLERLAAVDRAFGDLEISEREAAEAVRLRRARRGHGGGDATPLRELRWALAEWARALDELERWDDLVRTRREQVETAREIATLTATDDDRESVSMDLISLGDALAARGDHAEAASAYAESAEIRRALLAARPEDEGLLNGLCLALGELRDAQVAVGDQTRALATAQEAVACGRRQLDVEGSDCEHVRDFAIDLDELGDILRDSGDLEAADAAYAEAEPIFRRLLASDPASTRTRDDAAIVLGRRAGIRRDRGDAAGALVLLDEAVMILRGLVRDQPEATKWRRKLGGYLADLGEDRGAVGDREGALAAHEEAVPLLRATFGLDDGVDADLLRRVLTEAADAASAAGRPDRAAELRAESAAAEGEDGDRPAP